MAKWGKPSWYHRMLNTLAHMKPPWQLNLTNAKVWRVGTDRVWAAHLVRPRDQIFMGYFYMCSPEMGVEGMRKSHADAEGDCGCHTGLPVWGHEDNFFLITIPVVLSNFHNTISLVAYCIFACAGVLNQWWFNCLFLAMICGHILHILLPCSRTNNFSSALPFKNGLSQTSLNLIM